MPARALLNENEKADAHDMLVSRVKLYAATALTVGALMSGMLTLTVRWVTKDVRDELKATRVEMRALAELQYQRYAADSVRWGRMTDVVELAVAALAEPAGSTEQRRAVEDLRSRRRYTPRP